MIPRRHVFNFKISSTAAVVCVIACLLPAAPAGAQPRIPASIRSGEAPFSGRGESIVTDYIDHWFTPFTTGKGKLVSDARRQLTEPLTGAGSSIFKKAYSAKLSAAMERAVRSQSVLVRINAMIAVRELRDDRAVALATGGLADASPAVRLHAARAIQRFALGEWLGKPQQTLSLESLVAAQALEASRPVATHMLTAMSLLTVDGAEAALLRELNRRVCVHAANPRLPVKSEREVLTRLGRRFVEARIEGNPMPADTAEQMALVAFRFLCLSARLLPKADSESLEDDRKEMARLAEKILREVVPALARAQQVGVSLPPEPAGELKRTDVDQIMQRCRNWVSVLEKVGFTKEQITVPAVKKGAPSTTMPGSTRAVDT